MTGTTRVFIGSQPNAATLKCNVTDGVSGAVNDQTMDLQPPGDYNLYKFANRTPKGTILDVAKFRLGLYLRAWHCATANTAAAATTSATSATDTDGHYGGLCLLVVDEPLD
jgi:hypothetical protein